MQTVGTGAYAGRIGEVAARARSPETAEWAQRVITRHLRREPTLLARTKKRATVEKAIADEGLRADAAARILAAFDRGEAFFVPAPRAVDLFFQKAFDTMDWLHSLREDDRRIRRIHRMAWTDAEKLAEDWHAAIAKARKASGNMMQGVRRIHDLPDGWFMAELPTKQSLAAEGSAMGHCVGGYWNRVESGEVRIVSLRDPDGHPHVTIELASAPLARFEDGPPMRVAALPPPGVSTVTETDSTWRAVQVRGKGNLKPVQAYDRLVRSWMAEEGIPWAEGHRTFLPSTGGRTVTAYRAFKRTYLSAESARAYGERTFLREVAKNAAGREFRQFYSESGLAGIHAVTGTEGSDDFVNAVLEQAMKAFAARIGQGGSPASALASSGLDLLMKGLGGRAADSAAVYRRLMAHDAREASFEERVLLRVPEGRDLRLVIHRLPLMPLMFLSLGLAGKGREGQALDDVAPFLALSAARMADDPEAVHAVTAASGGVAPDDLRGAFLACGLAAEYAAAAAAVSSAVRGCVRDARTAVRKARMSGRHPEGTVNSCAAFVADGYAARIETRVRETLRQPALLVSTEEIRPPTFRPAPAAERPVLKTYAPPRHALRR